MTILRQIFCGHDNVIICILELGVRVVLDHPRGNNRADLIVDEVPVPTLEHFAEYIRGGIELHKLLHFGLETREINVRVKLVKNVLFLLHKF